jgi:hypothetical protein
MANWQNFLTEEGKKTMEMFKDTPLNKYYDPMNGCLYIPEEEFDLIKGAVLEFIKEYGEYGWMLTYGYELWIVAKQEPING